MVCGAPGAAHPPAVHFRHGMGSGVPGIANRVEALRGFAQATQGAGRLAVMPLDRESTYRQVAALHAASIDQGFLATLGLPFLALMYRAIDEATDSVLMIEEKEGFNCEVIYYSNAIRYLQENDPSLQESLEIAADLGYEVKNLNSEVLASLLKSQNVRDEFLYFRDEINEFFESLED